MRPRIDHIVLRLKRLIGGRPALAIIHMLGMARPFVGLPSQGAWEEKEWQVDNVRKEKSDILDIGASESLLRLLLRDTKHDIYGVDVRFLRGIDSMPNVMADAMHLPFREECFDYVVLGSTIEHIGLGVYGDPQNQIGDIITMKEARRIVRRGGFVIITTPYCTRGGLTWQRFYSDAMIDKLSEGFRIVKREYLVKTSGIRQRWKRITGNSLPTIECSDPLKAITCLLLVKPQ